MWLLYVLTAAWLLQFAGALWFAWQYQARVGSPAPAETEPPVTIIAPVKGAGPHLAAFLDRLRALDYPDYRVFAVVEAEDDPAVPVLRAAAARPGAPMSVLVAGLAETEGQKVRNIRHGLASLDDRTRIVAFVDADTLPSRDWLGRLAWPLTRDPDIAAVTGHRWIVPDDDRLASGIVAAANLSLIGVPRYWNVCWGGCLAMRRETIERLDLAGRLAGAVVDDLQITRVLRDEKLRILTPRGLVVLCPAGHDWRSAAAFARRQHLFVRWYLPGSWSAGVAMLTLPVVGCAAALALAASGEPIGWAALALAWLFGQLRASIRGRIAGIVWGGQAEAVYDRHRRADRWLAPLWITFHALCAWSTLVSRRMLWAGILYRVEGRNSTVVISRRPPD